MMHMTDLNVKYQSCKTTMFVWPGSTWAAYFRSSLRYEWARTSCLWETCLLWKGQRRGEGGWGRSRGFNGLIQGYMLSAWPLSRSTENHQLEPTQAHAKLMGSITRLRLCNGRYSKPSSCFCCLGSQFESSNWHMHHMDGFMHTDMEGLHINTWKGAEVGILFGTEHWLQMGASFGDMEGALILIQCSLFLPVATRLEGEVAALNPESLCFFGNFPVGLSSLIPSIIIVQMIIFLAALPKSRRSLAFPVSTRKWPGRGLSIAWLFSSFSEAAIHLSPPRFLTTAGEEIRADGWKYFFYFSICWQSQIQEGSQMVSSAAWKFQNPNFNHLVPEESHRSKSSSSTWHLKFCLRSGSSLLHFLLAVSELFSMHMSTGSNTMKCTLGSLKTSTCPNVNIDVPWYSQLSWACTVTPTARFTLGVWSCLNRLTVKLVT